MYFIKNLANIIINHMVDKSKKKQSNNFRICQGAILFGICWPKLEKKDE